MEQEIFKREDIKAGYLLCIENQKDGRKFNMTAIPAKSGLPSFTGLFVTITTGIQPPESGDLVCANHGEDWYPLSAFDDKLESENGLWRINAVYGYAPTWHAMANTIEGRDLLWRRYLPKLLTPAEIEKALGYPVVIIREGENRKPVGFEKSSLQPGMVVERRDGSKRLVVPTEKGLVLYLPPCSTVMSLGIYVDTAEGPTCPRLYANAEAADIVKVWGRVECITDAKEANTVNTAHRRLLWERDEAKRMTMKEIEKALGYPVVLVEAVADTSTVYAVEGDGKVVASVKV